MVSTVKHDFALQAKIFCKKLRLKGPLYDVPEAVIAAMEANYEKLRYKSYKEEEAFKRKKTALGKRYKIICKLWGTVRMMVTVLQSNPQWKPRDAAMLGAKVRANGTVLVIDGFGCLDRYRANTWRTTYDWINNFCGKLSEMEHPETVPLVNIRQLQADCEQLPNALEDAGPAIDYWQQCADEREAVGMALLKNINALFSEFIQNPAWTKEDILELGWEKWYVANNRFGISLMAPEEASAEMKTKLSGSLLYQPVHADAQLAGYKPAASAIIDGSRVRINIEKGIVPGVIVFSRLQGETGFTLLGYTQGTVFLDSRPVMGNKDEVREYRLKGLQKNDEVGQFSNVLTVRVKPRPLYGADYKPVIRLRLVNDRVRVEIEKKPGYSMNVYTRKEGETSFVFLGNAPKRGSFTDNRALDHPAIGERRYYFVLLVKDGKETGSPSDVHEFFLAPLRPEIASYKAGAILTRWKDYIVINFGNARHMHIGMQVYTRMQGETAFSLLADMSEKDCLKANYFYRDYRPHPKNDTRCRQYKLACMVNGQPTGIESDVYTICIKK